MMKFIEWLIHSKRGATKILAGVAVLIIVVMVLVKIDKIVENNDSGYTQVMQDFWDGDLSVRFDPGYYVQAFGKIWTYKKESTYMFTSDPTKKKEANTAGIDVMFNDGGECTIWGAMRYTLPNTDDQMMEITRLYMDDRGDPFKAFFEECVQQVVKKALVTTAALISTEQSFTSHRAQYSEMARDQVINGVYIVGVDKKTVYDSTKGQWELVLTAVIMEDANGMPQREPSYFHELGVSVPQFTINDFKYKGDIESKIKESRDFQTQIQAAEANAQKAEQKKKTAKDTGERDVTKAKYTASELKMTATTLARKDSSKAVINAQRDLDVALQDLEAAKENATGMIALARGESEARRNILAADGALVIKKEAYEKIMGFWTDALKVHSLVEKVGVASGGGVQVPRAYALYQAIDLDIQKQLGLNLRF